MKKIIEAFEVNDLKGVLVPKLHLDQYSSKIGTDEQILVLSFLINDKQAAIDIVDFFEKGYDFILDADISSSEITPGSYLVFVELTRRLRNIEQIFTLINDLSAASGLNIKEWKFQYINQDVYHPLTKKELKDVVPLTARSYKEHINNPIKEMKVLSGLSVTEQYSEDEYILKLKHAAGIDYV
jgi:hypothetical protein